MLNESHPFHLNIGKMSMKSSMDDVIAGIASLRSSPTVVQPFSSVMARAKVKVEKLVN